MGRKARSPSAVSVPFTRGVRAGLWLAADLFVGGVLDVVLVLQVAPLIPSSLQAPLVACLAGAIASAAWMFALLPAVSLAWVLGSCGALAVGLLLHPVSWMSALLPLVPLFIVVLGMAGLLNARLFARQARLNLTVTSTEPMTMGCTNENCENW